MESATTKPHKPSSNISEIVSKFAKVCKLRSIGVFPNQNSNHHLCNDNPDDHNAPLIEDSSDASHATEETECDGEKVHPQPLEVPGKSNVGGDAEILKLFDLVSALKLAYVQLQEAHIPYDPEKIIAADERVVAELEALSKIKRAYTEKQVMKDKLECSQLNCLRVEVEVNEKLLEKLKSQNRAKDAEIICLRQELQGLDLGNAKLIEKIRKGCLERSKPKFSLNIDTFKETFKAVSKSIHDFAKPFINLMRASGWDLEVAAKSIEDGVAYAKRSHKKYAFETYIARRMFHGMSLQAYDVDDVMRFDDPIDALIENPNSSFADFCRKKYLLVVHSTLEMSFFGNLDQRALVLSGKHPRTPFYQIFARMAKWIWVLQGTAASINPKAKIYSVNRGSEFSNVHMQSVDEELEGAVVSDKDQANFKVEIMIMPGFQIGETLVKSRVYLSKRR